MFVCLKTGKVPNYYTSFTEKLQIMLITDAANTMAQRAVPMVVKILSKVVILATKDMVRAVSAGTPKAKTTMRVHWRIRCFLAEWRISAITLLLMSSSSAWRFIDSLISRPSSCSLIFFIFQSFFQLLSYAVQACQHVGLR